MRHCNQDIVSKVGCRPDQFLPYIQPYEFEALLFSDVHALPLVEPTWSDAVTAASRRTGCRRFAGKHR